MDSARWWRATCGQLTLDLPTEESGRCVSLDPASLFYSAANDTILTGDSEIRARWVDYFEELHRVDAPFVRSPALPRLSRLRTLSSKL